MFGWNQDLTWKVAEIKPAEAPGFAEVTAVFNTPQGQQIFRLFVTPDQKFALTGDMVPFGADPFAAARADLKAANGPVHGAADAAVTIVEFGDLECPACKAAQPNMTKLLEDEPKAKADLPELSAWNRSTNGRCWARNTSTASAERTTRPFGSSSARCTNTRGRSRRRPPRPC